MTPKQEAFCRAYIETGNASEAYRLSYNAGNMKAEVIHVKACELLSNGNVAVRVNELKAEAAERHKMTVDDIAQMLKDDREFARECETPGPAVRATMGLARLFGLLTDKQEVSGKDGAAIKFEQVQNDADAFTSAIAGIASRK